MANAASAIVRRGLNPFEYLRELEPFGSNDLALAKKWTTIFPASRLPIDHHWEIVPLLPIAELNRQSRSFIENLRRGILTRRLAIPLAHCASTPTKFA